MKFTESLKNNYEFRRLYSKGKSAGTGVLVAYCRRGRPGHNRLGITVSGKIGNAVHRNRVRRRFREIYRLNEHRLRSGYDIVIVARVKGRYASYADLEKAFLSVCRSLGLLSDGEKSK